MKRIELIDQYEILESENVFDATGFICRLIGELPDSITEIRKEFLELAGKHLQKFDADRAIVDRFIALLHISTHGWRRNDIIKILGIPEHIFEELLWNLEKTVKTDRIGRISFVDPNIDKDYCKHIDTDLALDVAAKALAYLGTLPFDDPVYIEQSTVFMLRKREYSKLRAFFNSRRICGPQNSAVRRLYWDSFERNLLQNEALLEKMRFFADDRFNYDSAFFKTVYENIDRFRITDELLNTYIKVFNIGFCKYDELEGNYDLVKVDDIVCPHRKLLEDLCKLGSMLLDFIMNKADSSFSECVNSSSVDWFMEHLQGFYYGVWPISHMEEIRLEKSKQKLCIMVYRVLLSLKKLQIRKDNKLPENHWKYGTRWEWYHDLIVDGKSGEVFKWSYRILSLFIDELMLTLWYWRDEPTDREFMCKQIEIAGGDLLTATGAVDWEQEDPFDHIKKMFVIAELLEGIDEKKSNELYHHILTMYGDHKAAYLRKDSFSLLLTMGFAAAAAMKLGKKCDAADIANEIHALQAMTFEQLTSATETVCGIVSDPESDRTQAEEFLYNEAQKPAAADWIRVKQLPEIKKKIAKRDQN